MNFKILQLLLYVASAFDDIGILVELSNNKDPSLGFKQQSEVKTYLKKLRNLYLYDNKLFRNKKESKDFSENKEKKMILTLYQQFQIIFIVSLGRGYENHQIEHYEIRNIEKQSFRYSQTQQQSFIKLFQKIIQYQLRTDLIQKLTRFISIRGWNNNNQKFQRSN
ncbi:unnamed protein product [Paramecium pentaurelia]|uniref:Uncharacterized protein n=1 Tax=Paramecium pentaurelia TaxID=43138 RepID=A0A8S1RXG4_9CILI|nr:unnamed protein product [Paramecium pentaurelia]